MLPRPFPRTRSERRETARAHREADVLRREKEVGEREKALSRTIEERRMEEKMMQRALWERRVASLGVSLSEAEALNAKSNREFEQLVQEKKGVQDELERVQELRTAEEAEWARRVASLGVSLSEAEALNAKSNGEFEQVVQEKRRVQDELERVQELRTAEEAEWARIRKMLEKDLQEEKEIREKAEQRSERLVVERLKMLFRAGQEFDEEYEED